MKKLIVLLVLLLLVAGGGYYYYTEMMEPNARPAIVEDTVEMIEDVTADIMLQDPVEDTASQITNLSEEEQNARNATATQSTGQTNLEIEGLPMASAIMPRSLGDINAPVKVEEFASFTCGHCADFHNDTFPQFKESYIDTGKVHFTFVDFPLNAPALDASVIARCLPEDRYFQYISFLFKTQKDWAFSSDYLPTLRQNAKLLGATDEQLDECLSNDLMKEAILGNMQMASTEFEVNSTPSFVINGGENMIRGAQSYTAFSAYIDSLLADQDENTTPQ
jgi:protein-disulfide isomerase